MEQLRGAIASDMNHNITSNNTPIDKSFDVPISFTALFVVTNLYSLCCFGNEKWTSKEEMISKTLLLCAVSL